jgi:hypothetical protein
MILEPWTRILPPRKHAELGFELMHSNQQTTPAAGDREDFAAQIGSEKRAETTTGLANKPEEFPIPRVARSVMWQ